MAISIGTQLGSYEITALLGEGGMGRVFRARDTKLKREVAIKVLPDEFSRDPARLARFQREAEALAALNHSRVGAIYDLGEADDCRFLVMELVEGDTLAERLQRGSIPVSDALKIARQIAEALEAAHEKGIVHRDLKPGNIKITTDGQVKVLDFGLAKMLEQVPVMANLSQSPTMLSGTIPGMILGTAAYMSPEQVKGKDADRTSDIWAFGCVLFEMLTGRAAFEGETVAEIFGGILKVDPDWNLLPARTPEAIRKLMSRSLQKERTRRLQHIGEARIQIDDALNQPERTESVAPRVSRREWIAWTMAAVFAIGSVVSVFLLLRPPLALPEVRLEITTPPTISNFSQLSIAISPDGQTVAFIALDENRSQLWLRPLNAVSSQPLAKTEGALFPFWSPDGRSIGFFADGKLKRIDVASRTVQVLANAPEGRGGSWSRDGIILFASSTASPILRIRATGGEVTEATHLKRPGHNNHRYPYFLPDGKHFLFDIELSDGSRTRQVYVASLDGDEPRRLLDAESIPVFAPSGHLLFIRQGTLFAQKFDPKKLEISGDPIPVAKDLAYAQGGEAAISASSAGPLIYRNGMQSSVTPEYVWFDRAGKQLGVPLVISGGTNPELSLDGERLALTRGATNSSADIWLFEIGRGVDTRLTFDPAAEFSPVWSPDSKRILFGSNRKGLGNLYVKSANGFGNEELILETGEGKLPLDWSRDGKFILYAALEPTTNLDLWALPLIGDRKPFPVIKTSFVERDGQFSPDGKWVAYASNESGTSQIYVQPFPTASGKRQISVAEGFQPRWRSDGKEIFYIGRDSQLMAAPIRIDPNRESVEPGTPVQLFTTRILQAEHNRPIAGSNTLFLRMASDS